MGMLTIKGGILSRERMPPLEPQEKRKGRCPLTPEHCRPRLEKLHSRWQLRCLTDVAYPLRVIKIAGFLRFVTVCNRGHFVGRE